MPSLRSAVLLPVVAGVLCAPTTRAQHSIGGMVGWTHSDHWFRSTVNAGLQYTHTFMKGRMEARGSAVCHIPSFGRSWTPFDGRPAPSTPYATNNYLPTYDRYWGMDGDADMLLRLVRSEQRNVEVYTLGGTGYRNERFDYESSIADPKTGSVVEVSGRVLRDRFALRAGFGASMGAGAGKLFVEAVTDVWSYVADKSIYQAPMSLECYGIRFGFAHPLHKQ
ncbi:MAG: hypothetical protein WAU70_02215 [Flavobacteriales bacterium]